MTSTEAPILPDLISEKPVYSVGTLVYNKNQLIVLFIWLMWNDFGITLIESIGSLNGVMMRDHGATFTQMATLGSIGGFVTPWINPWVSTWSDRHRGRFGRRRPFLLIATPIYALFIMAIPFMPDLFQFLQRFPLVVRLFTHVPMNGPAFLIGTCGLAAGMFNAVVLAIFSYLYWDVVPENVMGRFNSLKATVALVAGVIWSFFIYGAAEHHMKQVYVGTGLVSLTIYLLSVWRIKEGEYPPPDPHTKGGAVAPIRAYFVECFSRPYYLWIFVASLLYQLGNLGGGYQFYFLHYDLKLDLWTIGHVDGIGRLLTAGFGLSLGFSVGILTDRLKPMRLIGPSHLLLALAAVAGYVFISGKWSYFAVVSVKLVAIFVQGIVVGAFTVEAFPREKLGQFCSAQAVFYQFFTNICNPAVGYLFDKLHNNRIGFLWMAGFYALAAMTYVKVYHNWKKRGEHPPDPNEPQGPRGFDPVLR